ncbi:insulinase family protein [Thalassomonas sp. RHCl1]|uniref:insulinase family protein n=1 Tax=Thalassomonas sp. RHCl1 TaxID=2995320 RepID=UPI00248D17C5|nr:insulinase family protein [Thalassomonas sp. RHCl1]
MKHFKPAMLALALTAALAGCQHQGANQASTGSQPGTNSQQIIKSPADQRDYRYLTLENGLKVLLISDPRADKSAAAMDVSVGAYHAPKDRAGLLHFLEHMLFLGTEKYPDAGEYNEFLKKNGGASNAYTSTEDTNYFFDVSNDAFDQALDRFAQFFIAPTMDPEFVEREKNAVDSEYSLKLKQDDRRSREAGRQALNPAHPRSMFSVGNLDTLADRGDDKVYDDLMEVYRRHYSANRMALVVLSNQPLPQIEKSVTEKFSAVKNNGLAAPKLPTNFLSREQLATRVLIEPLREMRTLKLTFPITDTQQYTNEKPTRLISHLLGHEGENSLYQRLNQQGLVESLSTYVENDDAVDAFHISLNLTEKGLTRIDDITAEIFAYIDLIKKQGVKEAYYREIKNIAALDFTFQEKVSPMRTVYRLSPVLQKTPAKHLLDIHYTYSGLNEALTRQYLSELNPHNMQQTLVAPGVSTDKNEPLYDVNYSVSKLPQAKLNQWHNTQAYADMKLPPLNPFIAEDIQLKEQHSNSRPALLVDKQGIKLWHYQDTSFDMPKASVFMRIESPLAANSTENRAMLTLASKLIEDKLNAYGFNAKTAGLDYRLFASDKGLGYSVNGYHDKQAELIKTINDTITRFDISEEKFALVKDTLLRKWKNSALDRPIRQVAGKMKRAFGEDPFSSKVKGEALAAVTLEQLTRYMQAMLSQVSLKVMTHGNTDKTEAIALGQSFADSFLSSAKTGPEHQLNLRQLAPGEEAVIEMDIKHQDSAIAIAYPAQTSLTGLKQTRMLGQVLTAAFFNDIRTRQQLGYVAHAGGGEIENMPTLNFYVQSSKVGPKELQKRIDQFILEQFAVVKAMSEAEFAEHKTGLITNIKRQDKNLLERTRRLWAELADGFDRFDKREQLAAAITAMSKQELVESYESLLMAPMKKRLISRNFGKAHRDQDFQNASKDDSVCRKETCWTRVDSDKTSG